jgi:hypothetical protein
VRALQLGYLAYFELRTIVRPRFHLGRSHDEEHDNDRRVVAVALLEAGLEVKLPLVQLMGAFVRCAVFAWANSLL